MTPSAPQTVSLLCGTIRRNVIMGWREGGREGRGAKTSSNCLPSFDARLPHSPFLAQRENRFRSTFHTSGGDGRGRDGADGRTAAVLARAAVPRDGITPTSYIRSGACCFSKGIMYERGEEGGRASARSIAYRCTFQLQYLPPSDDSLVPRTNRAQLESRSFRGVPGNCRAIKV